MLALRTSILVGLAASLLLSAAFGRSLTDGSFAASPDEAEKQLAEKFAPTLLLAGDDFKPKGVSVLTSDLSGKAQVQLKRATPAGGEVLLENPTQEQLCRFGEPRDTYLDIKDLEPLDEAGYWRQEKLLDQSFPDALYARVVKSGAQVTALQYWFFYYFQDWLTNHEGDWEMITLVFPPGSGGAEEILSNEREPVLVGYSQHNAGTKEQWSVVRGRAGGGSHPVVHVAVGSHASYMRPGTYSWLEHMPDDATGAISFEPSIELLPSDTPNACGAPGDWLRFPGRWGQPFGIASVTNWRGPVGPAQQTSKWEDPVGWVNGLLFDDVLWRDCSPSVRVLCRWAPVATRVTPGQRVPVGATVQLGQAVARFAAHRSGAHSVSASLISPSGRRIGPESLNPDVRHEGGAGFETYRIDLPESGDWTLELAGPAVGGEDVDVQVTVTSFPADSDRDGCADARELRQDVLRGGLRNPDTFWDFMDTPAGPQLQRDSSITVDDLAAIVSRFGSYDSTPGAFDRNSDPLSAPNSSGAPSGGRRNYHPAYDRTLAGPSVWNTGPPNGSITIEDLTRGIVQFGHTCR